LQRQPPVPQKFHRPDRLQRLKPDIIVFIIQIRTDGPARRAAP
jgi:hypothetical protein